MVDLNPINPFNDPLNHTNDLINPSSKPMNLAKNNNKSNKHDSLNIAPIHNSYENNNTNNTNDNNELISFLDKEKLYKKINFKKVFRFFSKCLKKSIFEMNNKFVINQITNLSESMISGINMIFHIYFILVSYSNNIKLTIFLLERSILLFTEFIIMSQDKKMVDEIYFVPNINDAVSFSFKKTIGSIIISDIENTSKNPIVKVNYKFLKEVAIVLRNIYKLYFRTRWINEETKFISLKIEENFENIDKIFHDKNVISSTDLANFKQYSALCFNQDHKNSKNTTVNPEHSLNLEEFLNTINNEIVESLLLIHSKDYKDILKKITCIISSRESISNKLGKIKIILFIYNEYYYLLENKKLESNSIFIFLKTHYDKKNIIIDELKERIFDGLVGFQFTKEFKHEAKEDIETLSININNIEDQIIELFNYIN